MRIAGAYTARRWLKLSARLDPDGRLNGYVVGEGWREAIDVVRVRFETRFVRPVEALRRFEYAGFLVVAIDALLAEAVERVRRGWRLNHGKSSELVATFLREARSFKGRFKSESHRSPFRTCPCIACDFYQHVRNGILHEGESQNGWMIRFGEPRLLRVAGRRRILDRNRFHDAVVAELRGYLADLADPSADLLRANLKRTLDAICAPGSRP